MASGKRRNIRVYDPDTGRATTVDHLIRRLGMETLAEKYGVSTSTVEKWLYGIHRPARRTLGKSTKRLL